MTTCDNADELADLQERLALYKAAEKAILGGSQSYSIGNRTVTMGDLDAILKQIERIRGQIRQLCRGNRISVQRVVPRDTV